jgi:hypothetical protein
MTHEYLMEVIIQVSCRTHWYCLLDQTLFFRFLQMNSISTPWALSFLPQPNCTPKSILSKLSLPSSTISPPYVVHEVESEDPEETKRQEDAAAHHLCSYYLGLPNRIHRLVYADAVASNSATHKFVFQLQKITWFDIDRCA